MHAPGEGAVQFQFFCLAWLKAPPALSFFVHCDGVKSIKYLYGVAIDLWAGERPSGSNMERLSRCFLHIAQFSQYGTYLFLVCRLSDSTRRGIEDSIVYGIKEGRNVFKSFLMLFMQGGQARTQGEDLSPPQNFASNECNILYCPALPKILFWVRPWERRRVLFHPLKKNFRIDYNFGILRSFFLLSVQDSWHVSAFSGIVPVTFSSDAPTFP